MNTSTTNAYSISNSPDIIFIITVFNLIFGLPTNVFVLQMIARAGREALTTDFFGLNLALTEILFCFFCILGIAVQSNFKLYIHVMNFTSGFAYFGCPSFQCCICLERYLAAVHPVAFLRYKLLRYKMVWCGLEFGDWVLFFFCVQFMNYFLIYTVYISSFLLILVSVNVFCCLAVLRVLKSPGPGDGDREKGVTKNIKMRAFQMILMMLLLMVINYIPVIIIVPLINVVNYERYMNICNICYFVVVTTGVVQPIIYIHRAGKLPCSTSL